MDPNVVADTMTSLLAWPAVRFTVVATLAAVAVIAAAAADRAATVRRDRRGLGR